jgi:hypothetical protein
MGTTLTIGADGRRFELGGRPAFLLGASYFGGLGAPEEFIREDLADLRRAGFNWIRVWAMWAAFDNDVSAFDADGDPRDPPFEKLLWLCELADELGLVIDVTLPRGPGVTGAAAADPPSSDEAHVGAAALLAEAMLPRRNVYLDVGDERDIADGRHVPIAVIRSLRDRIKQIDPDRLVTAGHAGDIEPDGLYEYVTGARVDFLAPHRPRDPGSPAQTQSKCANLAHRMVRLGKSVPIHYQQPMRRGLADWQPRVDDFLTDLTGAVGGGAAGWCLHNGHTVSKADGRPRRCFDLRPREGRLIDQLDDAERTVVRRAGAIVKSGTG